MRTEGKKDADIPEDIWQSWQQHWSTPEYKQKREQAAKNRRTEKGGPGTGFSTHTGGSRSTIAHRIALVRILSSIFRNVPYILLLKQLMNLIFEYFRKRNCNAPPRHMNCSRRCTQKKDGTFIDKRSKDINVRFSNFTYS